MISNSRTAKSVKNSITALGFYFLNLILQFLSRKIFLDHLGTEVLGLNTTASNLLQFLNLAELGIGTAIACTLYKPLFDKDTQSLNEIVSLQGWIYRKIAWIVLIGSCLLMSFFPLIFAKMPLPLWYAYASYGALLVSALLSYFINYKQIVLSADQQEYKIQYSYKASMLAKILCQIIAIKYLHNGYLWWLILEVGFAIIASIALNIVIKNTYPYLKTDLKAGKTLRLKYPSIITKIKQLFFHKIAGFALTQTSPVIIYAYASLTLVTLYGNYMLIIMGVNSLLGAIFNGMNASIGNLIVENNKQRILSVFEELFSIRFLLSCTACFGVYILTPSFITLWLGSEYVLDNLTLGIMVATLYINLTRTTIEAYLNAYGLFYDVWAPITEATINIVASIIFGHFWGLQGILLGVLLSLIIIVFCWKPYFLFKQGLKEKLRTYIAIYTKHIIILFVALLLIYALYHTIQFSLSINTTSLSYGLIIVIVFFLALFTLLFVTVKGMRNFTHRVLALIKH